MNYKCPYCGGMFAINQPVPSCQCPHCGQVVQLGAPQQPSQQAYQQPPQQPPYQQQAYQQPPYQQQAYQQPMGYEPGVFDNGPSGKSRGVAALLCFFLGGFGAHYFYVNKAGGGFICLLLSFLTCGVWSIVLLIQTIKFFTMTQSEFENNFVNTPKSFPIF